MIFERGAQFSRTFTVDVARQIRQYIFAVHRFHSLCLNARRRASAAWPLRSRHPPPCEQSSISVLAALRTFPPAFHPSSPHPYLRVTLHPCRCSQHLPPLLRHSLPSLL